MRRMLLWLFALTTGSWLYGQCPPSAPIPAPYSQDFSAEQAGTVGSAAGTALSDCWVLRNMTGNTQPRWEVEVASTGINLNSGSTGPWFDATSFGSIGGTYLYLETSSPATTGDTGYFESPDLDLATLTSAELRFSYHMYGATMGDLAVQVNDGTGWTTEWSVSGQQQTAGGDPWTQAIVDLSAYTGVVRVRFAGVRGTSFTSDMAIDDISIDNPPLCPTPFAQGAIPGPTTADVYWAAGDGTATNWEVEYGPQGFTQGTGTIITPVTNDTLALTGLMPVTTYEFYVREVCVSGGGFSNWVGPFAFTTLCAPFMAPYTENFENASVGPFTDFGNCWTVPSLTTPRWESEDATGGNENSLNTGPHFDNTNFGQSGGIYMFLETSSGAGTGSLESGEFDVSGLSVPYVEFYYHMYGAAMGTLELEVWDAANAAWVNLVSIVGEQQTAGSDPWIKATALIPPSITSNILEFRFQGIRGTSFTSDMSIDDFTVMEAPPCPDPTNISVVNIGGTSADIVFNSVGVFHNVEWGPSGFTQGTGTVVSDSSTTVSLTGLMSLTNYDVYVQADCDTNGLSAWIGPITFATGACDTSQQCGYTIDMSDTFGDGWNGNILAIEQNGVVVATFGAGFTTGTSFGPVTVNLCDGISSDVTVQTLGSWTAEVGFTITDPFGIVVLDHQPGQTFSSTTVFGNFTTQCVPPACPDPFFLGATNITANSADAYWTAFGSNFIGFNVEWGPTGFTQGTGTTFSAPNDTATITGLSPLTTYDYYVQMDCDTSGTSAWAGPFTFTTGCAAFSAPYFEDFENLNVGFANDFGNCWTQTGTTTNPRWELEDASGANENSLNTGPHYDNTQFGTPGGIYMYLETSGGAGNTRELISADVDVSSLTTPFVEFHYHMYGATMGTLALDVWDVNLGWTNDIVTFTGEQQTAGSDMWLAAGAVLPAGYDSVVRFRFRGTSGTSFNSDMSIDDFSVEEAPLCPDITAIVAGLITGFDAEILWNGQGGTNFNVEWGPAGFGQGSGTVIPTTNDSVVITGLAPVTAYDVYIQNDCSGAGNGVSGWVGPFTFTTTVTCPNPTNVQASPTASSAIFNWTPAGAADQNYVFGPAGTTPATGTIQSTTNNTVTVTGLTDNTPYTFWVRDSCGVGDVSIWEGPLDFTTLCLPTTAPYIETFTGVPAGQVGVLPPVLLSNCWEIGGTGGGPRWESEDASGANENSLNTGPWYDATSFGQSGGIYMYLETSTGTSTQAAEMYSPLVDISSLSAPDLSFAYHMYGATMDSLRVDIFDATTGTWDIGVWSAFGQQQTAGNDPWVTANIDLSMYGDTLRVRFNGKRGSSFTGDMSIDDVRFDEAPACLNPSFPGVITVNTTDATVYWTVGDPTATGWVVEYGNTGFSLGTGTQASATNDTTTLTGLTPSTNYEFYVAELCPNGIDTSNFVGPISFQTLCVAASIPYLRDFDGANWPPLCWTIGGPQPQMIGQDANDYLEAAFWSNNNAQALATTEPITISQDARVKFRWAHLYSTAYPLDQMILRMRLAAGTQWDTLADFNGPTFTSPNAANTTPPADVDFIQETYNLDTSYTGQDVVFEFVFNSDWGPNCYVDDFIVEPLPACPEPTTLSATNVTAFDATLSWANGNASASTWFVEYGPTGFALGSGTVVTATTNPFTLTGLSPATSYTAYVLELCANGVDTSAYSTPVSFNTACAPVTAPYIQNFTGTAPGISGSNPPVDLPNCFSLGADPGSGPRWETEDASGANENSLNTGPHFDNTTPATPGGIYVFLETSTGATTGPAYFTSPFIVTSSLSVPNLNFWYHMYGATMDSLRVDIYDQATQTWNVGVWSLFGQQQTAGSDPWQEANIPLSSYGDTIQVRFMGKRGSSFTGDMSLDDISIDEAPACPNPFSPGFISSTTNTGTVYWSAGSPGANNFIVEYGPGITQPGTGTTVNSTNDTLTLTGLMPSTSYCFFVYEICPNGVDTSNAVGPICFATQCAAVSAPYNTGFTGVAPGQTGTQPVKLELSNCWQLGAGPSAAMNWQTEDAEGANENSLNTGPFFDATTPNTAGGMYIYMETSSGATGDTAAVVSVPLDLGAGNVDLEFYYHMYGAAMGNLYTQINDGNGWVTLDSLMGNQQLTQADSFYQRVVPLTGYTGVVTIKFLGERGTSFTSDISLDEISLIQNGNPNCPTPTAIMDSAYCTSADISWVSGSGTSFIEYGPAGFQIGTGTVVNNATSPYTMTGLMLNTGYDYYVYDVCNGGADTSFGGAGSFTTPLGPVAAFTFSVNQGTVSFNASGSQGTNNWSWDFGDGNTGTGVMPTHTYLSNGNYTATLVVTDTSCGVTDTLSQIINITSVATCPQPSGLTTGNVECDSAVVSWTSISGTSLVQYGPAGFTPGTGTIVQATSPYTISGLTAGTAYDYWVADVCAASSDTSGYTGPMTFTTPTAPVPTLNVAAPVQITTTATEAEVQFDASGSSNVSDYTWDFGNGTFGSGPNPIATYQQNAQYFVTLNVSNGCGSADTVFAVVVIGIGTEEDQLAASLNIFPNPTQDVVNAVIENTASRDYSFELIDALGQVIETREVKDARGRTEVSFDLSNRAMGIYLLRVRTGNAAVTRRITRN